MIFPLNYPVLTKLSSKLSSKARTYIKQKAQITYKKQILYRNFMINYIVEAKKIQ